MKLLQKAIRGMLTGACVLGLSHGAMAESISLKVSTGFPSVHGTTTEVVLPWLKELGERSGVEIDVRMFAAGSSFGGLDRQLDQVTNGLVDAAVGLAVVPRGRMPSTGMLEIPFLGTNSRSINNAFNTLYKDHFATDFKGLKLVTVLVDCSVIHTVNTPVNTLEDLRGLRLRVPSAMGAELVKAVGGVPVAMPQSQIYESLQRNVIDGAITPWDVISSLKLGEVLNHHTDNTLFCGQLWFAFNQASFDKLPDAVKTTFEEMDGEYAVNMAQDAYDRWRKEAHAFAKENGNKFHKLSDEDVASWATKVQPAIDTYLDGLEAGPVANAREIAAALSKEIAN